ncbi:MAG: 4-hydroxythreonine-4-phosphate dehydrogenase PdxA [Nitrospiraceae bacterium]|nr:4-hydroxythreonine-4-phosphate dehydrogenase PdxA [Nitrospiraceae bacterium]
MAAAETGAASVAFIKKAVELARIGCIEGMVTAPINKEAIKYGRLPVPRPYRVVGRSHSRERIRHDDRGRAITHHVRHDTRRNQRSLGAADPGQD